MTRREKQLLEWIEENPLISQQELATRAGITRSSVAVHISNLMKKGMILGKGYIVHKSNYVVVIGGVNMDIFGRPYNPLIKNDSNPGQVRMTFGGVARNIAHNLRLLGVNIKLITAFGEDVNAQKIIKNCADLGIDTTSSLVVPSGVTSSYLFITSSEGDMELAVSDMEIYRYLTPDYIASKMDIINNASLCIIDANLSEGTINYLAEHCTVPIFADPVSSTKAKKLIPSLSRIHSFKPNLIEAELLTGIKITDEESMKQSAKYFLDQGVKQIYLSLGKDGVYCASKHESAHLPCLKTNLINATGGGDSFMAAIVWAYLNGLSLIESTKLGLAASSICCEGKGTINDALTIDAALKRARLDITTSEL
ncbi:PfkB family carbohydrate kinase [Anaerosporobacter sp.]|uniref:PfkB family carbohydrate kinase n=1 Tax=Anaerosporobacter sp. TaxID=1872529 RepID=UPI00286F46EE|nr:PfkB family carbohydrate kinase [Anaerosporobacter sp.]